MTYKPTGNPPGRPSTKTKAVEPEPEPAQPMRGPFDLRPMPEPGEGPIYGRP